MTSKSEKIKLLNLNFKILQSNKKVIPAK